MLFIMQKIIKLYNDTCKTNNNNEVRILAVDGSNSNDNKQNIMLNM